MQGTERAVTCYCSAPLSSPALSQVLRRPGKHVWVVRTEHFEEDVAGLWGWLCLTEAQQKAPHQTHPQQI